jgi:hypothetical protein
MSAFLYFIPHVMVVAADDVRRVGITALDNLDSIGLCQTEKGPNGGPGVVFATQPDTADGSLPKIGMYGARQQWIACFGGQFWLGWETATPPTPSDLLRTECIAGHMAGLDDGNEWMIPTARAFGRGSALPQALMLGPDGELVAQALPRFARLSNAAEKVFAAFLGDGEDLTLQQCWDVAVMALGQNYRLSQWEVSALQLLNTDNVQTVLGHLIDMPTVLAKIKDEKKNQFDTDNLSVGLPV